MGFAFRRTGKYTGVWQKKTEDPSGAETCKEFAESKKLLCLIEYPQERRSADYRQQFFRTNMGLCHKGKHYQCVYCGRIFPKDQITVDHLFAVKGVQRSKIMKWLLHRLTITDVNDPKNLVPACRHCNSKKGSKGGIWILRGVIGQSFTIWLARWIMRVVLIALCVYFVIQIIPWESLTAGFL